MGTFLLHHPFDSYGTVEEFIEAGAMDPTVITMRQTLYRTSKDSPIFRALIEAGQNKDVTVVVELMAASTRTRTSAGRGNWRTPG